MDRFIQNETADVKVKTEIRTGMANFVTKLRMGTPRFRREPYRPSPATLDASDELTDLSLRLALA